MREGTKRKLIPSILGVLALLAAFLCLCSCQITGEDGDPDPTASPKVVYEKDVRLEDGTVVYGYYVNYFRSQDPDTAEDEAVALAAALSLCDLEGIELSAEQKKSAEDKVVSFVSSSLSHGYATEDDYCVENFGVFFGEYKKIYTAEKRVELLYERLMDRSRPDRGEVEEYIKEHRAELVSQTFLKAVFDGRKLPELPESMAGVPLPEEVPQGDGFVEMLLEIGRCVSGTDDFLALREANFPGGSEQSVADPSDLLTGLAEEYAYKVSAALSDVRSVGGIASYYDGKNYILLYCIEYDEPDTEEELDSIAEHITSEKIEAYISGHTSAVKALYDAALAENK